MIRLFSFLLLSLLVSSEGALAFGRAALLAVENPIQKEFHSASELLDLQYDPEVSELKLDLYLPERDTSQPVPVIVLIHGGCFTGGKRTDMTWFAKEFQRQGFAAATITYRLAPQHFYPTGLRDVQQAVRFLRENAGYFKIHSRKIGAMGLSAGGYLAAALGVRENPVQAVVNHYGRTDFTLPQRNPDADCAEKFLGFKRRQNMKAFEEASILPHVSSRSAVFQIAHGTEDKQVIPYHSEVLHERLRQNGVSSELIWVQGAGHGFSGADFTRTWNAAIQFFKNQLF